MPANLTDQAIELLMNASNGTLRRKTETGGGQSWLDQVAAAMGGMGAQPQQHETRVQVGMPTGDVAPPQTKVTVGKPELLPSGTNVQVGTPELLPPDKVQVKVGKPELISGHGENIAKLLHNGDVDGALKYLDKNKLIAQPLGGVHKISREGQKIMKDAHIKPSDEDVVPSNLEKHEQYPLLDQGQEHPNVDA